MPLHGGEGHWTHWAHAEHHAHAELHAHAEHHSNERERPRLSSSGSRSWSRSNSRRATPKEILFGKRTTISSGLSRRHTRKPTPELPHLKSSAWSLYGEGLERHPTSLALLPRESAGEGAAYVRLLQALLRSTWWQLLVATLIVLNVFVVALEADFPRRYGHVSVVEVWTDIRTAFLVFFTVELVFRALACGISTLFCGAIGEVAWNLLDVVVVVTGWADLVASMLLERKPGSSLMQVVRALRIVRITRVVRVFRTIPKLRMLVQALVESTGIVLWISVMMAMMMLVMAIFCTTVVGHNADLWGAQEDEIRGLFGTVRASMQTLFQYLTLCDWSSVARLVASKMPWMMPVFMGYVIFASFAVLSLLTGVMTEHMNAVREAHAEEEQREQEEHLREVTRLFYKAFQRVDRRGDDAIGLDEFCHALEDERLVQALGGCDRRLLGLEARELFDLLDADRDGRVTWCEFRQGLAELRESPASLLSPLRVASIGNKLQQFADANGRLAPVEEAEDQPAATPEVLEASLNHVSDTVARAEAASYGLESTLAQFRRQFRLSAARAPDQ